MDIETPENVLLSNDDFKRQLAIGDAALAEDPTLLTRIRQDQQRQPVTQTGMAPGGWTPSPQTITRAMGLGPMDLTPMRPPGGLGALIQSQIYEESRGNPDAVSPKGAIGLMQVMPETAREMGVDPEEMRRNPWLQIATGTKYLIQQYQRFGNWRDALMAYVGGPQHVIDG